MKGTHDLWPCFFFFLSFFPFNVPWYIVDCHMALRQVTPGEKKPHEQPQRGRRRRRRSVLGEEPRLCENVGPRLRSTHASAGLIKRAETSSQPCSTQQQSAVLKVTISDVLSSAGILFFCCCPVRRVVGWGTRLKLKGEPSKFHVLITSGCLGWALKRYSLTDKLDSPLKQRQTAYSH